MICRMRWVVGRGVVGRVVVGRGAVGRGVVGRGVVGKGAVGRGVVRRVVVGREIRYAGSMKRRSVTVRRYPLGRVIDCTFRVFADALPGR